MAKGKKKDKVAKKPRPSKLHKNYDKGKIKNKPCPKCGAGYFLAAHKERTYCGKCHYTEFVSKKEIASKK